jgi:hypothetical protein
MFIGQRFSDISLIKDLIIVALMNALVIEFYANYAQFPPSISIPKESDKRDLVGDRPSKRFDQIRSFKPTMKPESILIKPSPVGPEPIPYSDPPQTPSPTRASTTIDNITTISPPNPTAKFPSAPERTQSLTTARPVFPITPPRSPIKLEINKQHISHETLFESTLPKRRKIVPTFPPPPKPNSAEELIALGVGPNADIEYGLAHLGFENLAKETPDAIALVWLLSINF